MTKLNINHSVCALFGIFFLFAYFATEIMATLILALTLIVIANIGIIQEIISDYNLSIKGGKQLSQ